MNPILTMKDISKTFPGVQALDGVNCELHKGEVLVILGENGAGKSTLMKILSGVYMADSGTIHIEGKEESFSSPRDSTRAGISMIYQELNLVPTQTIAQNILMRREPRLKKLPFIIDQRTTVKMANNILSSVEMDIDPLVKVTDISVAQQQMVAIAKAISSNAKIIIMDEPTATLTEKEIQKLFSIIQSLKGRGLSVIYISHRLQEVHRIGDRCMVLRDGKVAGFVNLADVQIEDLISMMIGEKVSATVKRPVTTVGEEAIRIENLKGIAGSNDATILVNHGEVVGLAGVVGSGRTELAQQIFGIDRLRTGEIFVHNKRTTIRNSKDAVRKGIGLLPEDRRKCGLFIRLTFRENVVSAAYHILSKLGITRPAIERREAREYKNILRINTPNINRQVRLLSGGNQQKTVVAKWLCSQSKILIFDDPTRGVDVGARREVHQIMNELTKNGAAILMISSDLSELINMSDRIYVMNSGRIVAELVGKQATHSAVFKYATQQL